ncbi:hypothetical protein OAM04_01760 [bacterium]|nr:hypothetical protein [Verrucomicrobiales bacterium]MDC0311925.1 hypothetical protein [bacterium]MDC0321806.1 hypothetical protein [Verrucomicrobiales bacterium]
MEKPWDISVIFPDNAEDVASFQPIRSVRRMGMTQSPQDWDGGGFSVPKVSPIRVETRISATLGCNTESLQDSFLKLLISNDF